MDARVCSIDGCKRRWYCRNLCTFHWRRWKLLGDPLAHPPLRRPPEPRQCSWAECKGLVEYGGLCKMHMSRKRQGLPMDAPYSPGIRGRKPVYDGIPPHLRSAVTRTNMAYRRGEKPTDADRLAFNEYYVILRELRRLRLNRESEESMASHVATEERHSYRAT
jgi:hypothetical protein